MALLNKKWISATALAGLALGGYGLYLATAQGTPPRLAQAPMNVSNVIPPAFIMGVDDSGSMTFQTLLPGRDGAAHWARDSGGVASFFNTSGVNAGRLRTGELQEFYYVAPFPGPRVAFDGAGNILAAIPPLDAFGFSRSHVYNPAYFNPSETYLPWRRAMPVGGSTSWPQSNPAAAMVDPTGAGVGSIDLTALRTVPAASDIRASNMFRLRTGMQVPGGTIYFDGVALQACGMSHANSSVADVAGAGWRTLTSAVTMSCDVSAAIAYFPATFYLPENAPAPAGYRTAARRLSVNACSYAGATGTTACNMYRYEIRPENYSDSAQYEAAINNFANWFTYYGARNRAMVAAVTNAMAESSRMRVGYFTINSAAADVTMRDMNRDEDRVSLFEAVYALRGDGATPNLSAVQRIGEQFRRTDAGAPIQLSCQRNAGMLFTDGYSNGASPVVGNIDGGMGVPFQDRNAGTMADIASRYYLNSAAGGLAPLRSGVGFPAGQVRVDRACDALPLGSVERNRLDCERDLHMNFYGITLGAKGVAYDGDNPRDPFLAPYINWPGYVENTASTVDDIWHATVNTRGEFINARTPAEITSAMRRVLAAVNEGRTPAGTIGQTGSRIGAGSLSVTPRYESANKGTDWYGELLAEVVTLDPNSRTAVFSKAWEAGEKLQAMGASARNIKFAKTTSSVVPLISDFNSTSLSLADLCDATDELKTVACNASAIGALAGGGMTLERVVAYLRGDRRDEGALRTRSSLLGDIVGSSPVVVAPTDDYGYASLGGALGTSYAAFLKIKRERDKRAVLVGANAGMFHVFDGTASSSGGNEWFAYVPATSLSHMGNLLFPYVAADRGDQKFDRRYFVDGPVAVSDVHDGSGWRTIAVGTSGAGGRSVFALDITDPEHPQVLWEVNNRISGNDTLRDSIGYVLGRPVIVPIKTTASGMPSWKVVFGNGFNSARQQASLFVVDAISGDSSVITASQPVAPSFNGLGAVAAVDVRRHDVSGSVKAGADGFVDTVYAADQNGAVWKFDLLSNRVDLGGAPLFVATGADGGRQTILGGLTTTRAPRGGVMVLFGTGAFSFEGDPADQSQQTLYGILDAGVVVTGRAQLQQQRVGATAGDFRSTSTTSASYASRGWYIDLQAGERFVGNPRVESGVAFFPVYAASSGSSSDCSQGGVNWLYGLDSTSGAAAMGAVRIGGPSSAAAAVGTGALRLVSDGSAPVKDVSVLTAPRPGTLAAGASDTQVEEALAQQCNMVVRVAGAPPLYLPRPCGRQSWRQLRG